MERWPRAESVFYRPAAATAGKTPLWLVLAALLAGFTCGLALTPRLLHALQYDHAEPRVAIISSWRWPVWFDNLFNQAGARADLLAPDTAAHYEARSRANMLDPAVTPSSFGAQTVDPEWSAPENVSGSAGRAINPVVLAGAGDELHLLWEEDDRIHHAVRRDGRWSTPLSVATGQRPSAGLAADGTLHVVFSNEFAGRYNVFYVAWSENGWTLPRLVSKTPGMSTFPSLALDRAGVVHAAWADTSPGFSIIYHGWLQNTWLNEPLRNARGTAPVLVLDGSGDVLHLAYQASGISNSTREIFHLQGQKYQWSLPENISISAENESLGVAMACAPDGTTHLAWQEHVGNKAHIRYVGGRRGAWPAPREVSDLAEDAREPALLVTQERQLSLAWRQVDAIIHRVRSLGTGAWGESKPLVANPLGLGGPALAGGPAGDLHLVWSGWSSASERDIFHSQHGPLVTPKVYIPGVMIGGR